MARCQLSISRRAPCHNPACGPTCRPALALAPDHRLNDRRHRRVRHPTNPANNRICASTTLDDSPLIAAPNGGSARGYRDFVAPWAPPGSSGHDRAAAPEDRLSIYTGPLGVNVRFCRRSARCHA
jgi:hypothetical protein